jgi:Zn-dependent alcohol dehydrogenase
MKTRAAVAFEVKRLLEIVEVDLEGPKAGEVLVELRQRNGAGLSVGHEPPIESQAAQPVPLFQVHA